MTVVSGPGHGTWTQWPLDRIFFPSIIVDRKTLPTFSDPGADCQKLEDVMEPRDLMVVHSDAYKHFDTPKYVCLWCGSVLTRRSGGNYCPCGISPT